MHHRSWLVLNVAGVFVVSAFSLSVPTYAQRLQVQSADIDNVPQARSGAQIQQKDRKSNASTAVSLSVSDSTLRYVIQSLANQAGLKVFYDIDNPAFSKRISIRVQNVRVLDAINTALKGTGLTAKLTPDKQTVMIGEPQVQKSPTADSVAGQGRIIGFVLDSATRAPLRGVTIRIQGTKLGGITGDDGRFVLSGIPTGEQVVMVRLIGYVSAFRTVTVTTESQNPLRITLTAKTTQLSEVVTSVTGQQRKIEIGNDITSINVDSVLRIAPISTVTDLLETRVPGLTVIRSSGVPGAPSRLRLRGIGGGLLAAQANAPTNDPIVIVDGIRIKASQSGATDQNLAGDESIAQFGRTFPPPSAIDQIDPNSIDKIEVLKGPSAAALYGSDAANGVIVITTKRGREGPLQWSVTGNEGIEYIPGFYAAPGYYPFCSPLSGGISGQPTICTLQMFAQSSLDSVVRFQALNVPRLTQFGTGHADALTATVSGGTRALTYSVTGSVQNNLGLLEMPALYRDLFKSIYDSSAPKWMRRPNVQHTRSFNTAFVLDVRPGIRTTLATRLTSSDQGQSSAQLQLSTLATQYIDTVNLDPGALLPYVERGRSNRFVSDFSLVTDVNLIRDFPLTGTIGFSRDNREDTRFRPYGTLTINTPDNGFYSVGSMISETRSARVNGTIFPGRRVSVAVGTDVTQPSSKLFQAEMDSLAPGVTVPTQFSTASQSRTVTATGGWFVEPRLNLNSRFFVNPGFRLDGNSTSGSRASRAGIWSLFPRLNFSYVAIDRQETTPLFGVISLFRPRVSFGVAGVQAAPGWQLRLLKAPHGATNFIEQYGLEMSTLGNTQLRPERTREIEGGFDLDLWGGRASMTITQFHKMRTDAIEQIAVAPSVYGERNLNQYRNIGRVRNTGTEFTLNATVIEHPIVAWTVNFSISKYSNRLITLNSEQLYLDIGNGTRLVAGYPLFGRWSRPILGYAPSDPNGRLSNADIIVGDTAVYVGQQAPNFELPFSTGLSFFRGRVSLNATFQYKDGFTQFNQGSQNSLSNLYFNPDASLADQAAALAASCYRLDDTNTGPCTDYGLIQTVNLLRFSSLSIGYNAPQTFAKRLRVSRLSVALQGANLGLWTSYRGNDPDVNSIAVGDATMDTGQLPQPRSWRLQISVGN